MPPHVSVHSTSDPSQEMMADICAMFLSAGFTAQARAVRSGAMGSGSRRIMTSTWSPEVVCLGRTEIRTWPWQAVQPDGSWYGLQSPSATAKVCCAAQCGGPPYI